MWVWAGMFSSEFSLRRRSDHCHSLDHRWWGIPAPPLQGRWGTWLPYVSHPWRNAKCVCICCLPRFCSWHAAFEWRSDNESLGQTKMCCFCFCILLLSLHSGWFFCMFAHVGQCVPASQVTACSFRRVRRNSGPTNRSIATSTYHQIYHVCPTCCAEILSQHTWAFCIILSFQGKCGQGDQLECRWHRSIDILGIRNQSQCSLALQVTQCQIQIHRDPPSFPSFFEVSGVHGPGHGLRWLFCWLCPKWWNWVRTVPPGLGLREEHHGKDHH